MSPLAPPQWLACSAAWSDSSSLISSSLISRRGVNGLPDPLAGRAMCRRGMVLLICLKETQKSAERQAAGRRLMSRCCSSARPRKRHIDENHTDERCVCTRGGGTALETARFRYLKQRGGQRSAPLGDTSESAQVSAPVSAPVSASGEVGQRSNSACRASSQKSRLELPPSKQTGDSARVRAQPCVHLTQKYANQLHC